MGVLHYTRESAEQERPASDAHHTDREDTLKTQIQLFTYNEIDVDIDLQIIDLCRHIS